MHNYSIRLAILSDLQLCPIPSNIVDSYEQDLQTDIAHWLHNQFLRYAIHIHDFGERNYQYCIPLLDLTVVAGDGPLLFDRRAPKDAYNILPRQGNNCRLIIFPQTRYSFVEDEV